MSSRGFTLVELLTVITIIAVLAGIGLVNFSGVQSKGRDSTRKSDLRALAQALEIYYQKNDSYINPAGGGPTDCANDMSNFYTNIRTYVANQKDLKDPLSGQNYCYIPESSGQSFRLYAKLENCSDPEIIDPPSCSPSNWNFSVTSADLTIALGPTSGPSPTSGPTSSPTPAPTSTPSPTPSPTPVLAKKVFVTSSAYLGHLAFGGGLAGGNSICQSKADLAGLGGTWKAWLYDASHQPENQGDGDTWTQFNGPYKLVDGTTVVADNWGDLDGTLDAGINKDEAGNPKGGYVWTGYAYFCSNWTSQSDYGNRGIAGAIDGAWKVYQVSGDLCNTEASLYCFEQ